MNCWMVRLLAPFATKRKPQLTELTMTKLMMTHTIEILDFGYPQNSESDTLKMYITTEGVKSEQAVVRIVLLP
jgi:hypothetical protein